MQRDVALGTAVCCSSHAHSCARSRHLRLSHKHKQPLFCSYARFQLFPCLPSTLPSFPLHLSPFLTSSLSPNPPPCFLPFLSFLPPSIVSSLHAHSSPPPFHSLSLHFSLSLSYTHACSLAQSYTHSPSLSVSFCLCSSSFSLFLSLPPSLSLSLSFSLSHFVASSLVRSVSRVLSHSLCSLDPPHSSLGPLPSLSHR